MQALGLPSRQSKASASLQRRSRLELGIRRDADELILMF
jgi:hypothetical protein